MKWFRKKSKNNHGLLGRWRSNFQHGKVTQQAINNLVEQSRLERSFFVMCGLSGLLATIGLMLNDTVILISAMVLAPLLNPVLAVAAGISLRNKHLSAYALKSLMGGVIFVIFIAALLTKFVIWQGIAFDVSHFAQKCSENAFFFYLAAFVSGFAGVYAWLRAVDLSNLIGVAIAVALIPIVSFLGVLIGMEDFAAFYLYGSIFVVNILTITAGAVLAFLILGFSRQKKMLTAQIEEKVEAI